MVTLTHIFFCKITEISKFGKLPGRFCSVEEVALYASLTIKTQFGHLGLFFINYIFNSFRYLKI